MYRVTAKRYELAKMAVDPKCRGRGYGDVLMKAAEDWARAQGADEIFLLSNTRLEPAIALYKKHGYETTRLGPHPHYDRCNIEMTKSLIS
jgi:putative acetyltransferase